ncbi:MAG: hypothetical protein ACLUAK_04225 [Dialister invisus]|nr:hypothetical protein [Dialister invisus]
MDNKILRNTGFDFKFVINMLKDLTEQIKKLKLVGGGFITKKFGTF